MAPVTPEAAARDIVHFAILDETGPVVSSDLRNPFVGNKNTRKPYTTWS